MSEDMGFTGFSFLLVAACADRPFFPVKLAVICMEFPLHSPRLDPMPVLLRDGLTWYRGHDVKPGGSRLLRAAASYGHIGLLVSGVPHR